MDDDPPLRPEDARTLRFLRVLVTVLTTTMIVGMAVLVVLFATRFPRNATTPTLPDTITLPAGETARAVTMGTGWVAVVTADDEILILDPATGAVRQRIAIEGE